MVDCSKQQVLAKERLNIFSSRKANKKSLFTKYGNMLQEENDTEQIADDLDLKLNFLNCDRNEEFKFNKNEEKDSPLRNNVFSLKKKNIDKSISIKDIEAKNYKTSSISSGLKNKSKKKSKNDKKKKKVKFNDDIVAQHIASRLKFKCTSNIVRIVKLLGRKLAMKICSETVLIESSGGFRDNLKKRKSAFESYLYLIDCDSSISKSKKKQIFSMNPKINEEKGRIKCKKIEFGLNKLKLSSEDKNKSKQNELNVFGNIKLGSMINNKLDFNLEDVNSQDIKKKLLENNTFNYSLINQITETNQKINDFSLSDTKELLNIQKDNLLNKKDKKTVADLLNL